MAVLNCEHQADGLILTEVEDLILLVEDYGDNPVFFLVSYFWAPFAVYACFCPTSQLSDWDVHHSLILLTTSRLLRTN